MYINAMHFESLDFLSKELLIIFMNFMSIFDKSTHSLESVYCTH